MEEQEQKEVKATSDDFNIPVFDNQYDSHANRIVCASDFTAMQFEPRRSILHPWLSERTISLISGVAGCGKTFFALSIVDSICRGVMFGPWEVQSSVNCLYIDAELTNIDLQNRLKILSGMHMHEPYIKNLYVYSANEIHDRNLPQMHLENYEWQEFIERYCRNKKVGLVVFDNIASLTPGLEENSKKEWDSINQFLIKLKFGGISSLLLHHMGKDDQRGPRGTSARLDNIDSAINLVSPRSTGWKLNFTTMFLKKRVEFDSENLVQPFDFELRSICGVYSWSYNSIRESTKKDRVLHALYNGKSIKDIAREVSCNPSYVYRIRDQAIKDGYLTEEGKPTGRLPEEEPGYEGDNFNPYSV
jgi:putative DNA primase/helicase